MTNFIFKSANRLTKNSPITNANLDRKLDFIQSELRHNRSDMVVVLTMLNKLLVDKHLQFQVDDFFENQEKNASNGE